MLTREESRFSQIFRIYDMEPMQNIVMPGEEGQGPALSSSESSFCEGRGVILGISGECSALYWERNRVTARAE